MNFFNIKTSWSNLELGILKICVGSVYIIIGSYFHEFINKYIFLFAAIFLATAIWIFSLWIKKMKNSKL
ncbi:MAG: hypothetical protein ACOYO1_03025 [Bacteroidales bacterium]